MVHALNERSQARIAQMRGTKSIVVVIDDDPSVREALQGLLETADLEVELFASPQEFMQQMRKHRNVQGCIILDVRLPGSSGLDFQRELARAGIHMPVIFLTGHADIPMTVQAIKAGAVDFLTKPYRDQTLLEAVLLAIDKDRAEREIVSMLAEIRLRFESLTPREREVMALIVAGQPNKQIAGKLGIGEVTARVHRRQVMFKMKAKSLADLVRMADALKNTK
jgi:FixJ family two-component response regulator